MAWYGATAAFFVSVRPRFFGTGAYAYAISAQNFGETAGAVFIAIAAGALLASILGYFMFYGRISDVYLGVITLTVTLIIFNLLRRTSGPEYKIGKALLGGFNGTNAPLLQVPWDGKMMLLPNQMFYVSMGGVAALLFRLRLAEPQSFRASVPLDSGK